MLLFHILILFLAIFAYIGAFLVSVNITYFTVLYCPRLYCTLDCTELYCTVSVLPSWKLSGVGILANKALGPHRYNISSERGVYYSVHYMGIYRLIVNENNEVNISLMIVKMI